MSSKKKHLTVVPSHPQDDPNEIPANAAPNKAPKRAVTASGEKFDGVQSVAEMLKVMDSAAREKLLARLDHADPRVSAAIRDKLLTFENLLQLSPKSIQILLKDVPRARWILALRGVSEDFLNGICAHLSERAASILREEIAQQGQKRLSEVKTAQKEIVQIAEKWASEGKIFLE